MFPVYINLMLHIKVLDAYKKINRAISTSKLHMLPCLHTWPINVVVFYGSNGEILF